MTAQLNYYFFFKNKFLSRGGGDGDALEKQGHGVPSCSQAWEENKGGRGRRRNASLKDADPGMGGLDSFLFKRTSVNLNRGF